MARFKISARERSGRERVFVYDNSASTLTDEEGRPVVDPLATPKRYDRAPVTTHERPLGKVQPRVLKISLGLSCNYACSYCSQRFVPHADQRAMKDVHAFLAKLPTWFDGGEDGQGRGVTVEFWGGEPLVYIKPLRVLAGALRSAYPNLDFLMITNGSLLTPEINAWLDEMGFSIGLSHDGPGQHVRGPDPLDNPAQRAAILDLWARLGPKGRMSFNAMLNRQNQSRAAIQRFFQELTGDPDVPVGEGTLIDAYDEGGKAASLRPDEHLAFRRRAFDEIVSGQVRNVDIVGQKIRSFVRSLENGRPAESLGQKCGMDRPDNLTVDLKGDVITCQNVSSAATAPNGRSHKIGTVEALDEVRLDTSRHWSTRPNCSNCPVLQLCQGSCMFLEGDLWWQTCANSYSDNVSILAAAIYFLTGAAPYRIEGPHPKARWWIFEEEPAAPVVGWHVVGGAPI